SILYSLFDCFILRWLFFFFSSRRRHTRFSRDWSSDVCSSDLACHQVLVHSRSRLHVKRPSGCTERDRKCLLHEYSLGLVMGPLRSEERRVGKECRSRWWAER